MLNQDESEPLWILIWRKGWKNQDWLTTSFFSGVLISEFYKILISVYPLCMTELWMLLGAQSVFIVTLLNIISLIFLSLMLGWIIYSLHLASIAIHTFENEYQPLIEMWQVQNPIYYDLLKKLITREDFVSLSQWLSHEEVPESIKDYLLNEEACENLDKVISLLQLILTSEDRDSDTKQQLMELLIKNLDDPNQNEQIGNICQLGLLLWDGEFLDSDKFIDVLKNSSTYTNYLPQLENAYQQPDLMQQLLETPKLMTYYSKCIEYYPNQPQEISEIINSLVPYLHEEYSGPISKELFLWISQTYHDNPEKFLKIWKKIYVHQQLDFIQAVVSKYKNIPNFDTHFIDILNIENPRMDMVPLIKDAIHFRVPFKQLSECQHLQTLQVCLEYCHEHFPHHDVLKVIDQLEIIDKKSNNNPEGIHKLINLIFHPKPISRFKKFNFLGFMTTSDQPHGFSPKNT